MLKRAATARRHLADLGLIVLIVAIGVRLWLPGLDRSFWLDEEMIAMNLRDRDMAGLVGALDHNQAAPLAWLWVEKILLIVLGPAEWALRLQPFAFGIGTLGIAYWFGRRWLNQTGTAALVALFGFSFGMLLYTSELKHYSSDVFWVMVLIFVARWAMDRPGSARRLLCWWAAAVVGSWLSMGAILATPAMAIVLIGHAVWAQGVRPAPAAIRAALTAGLPGLVWLVSFGTHYLLSLKPASSSDYLADYWSGLGYPPDGAGFGRTVAWLGGQVETVLQTTFFLGIGDIPRGLAILVSGCLAALTVLGIGWTLRRQPAFGLILCAPLVSAGLLALLRVVPLYGRLALWLVPAVFVAVAQAMQIRPERAPMVRWIAVLAFLPMAVPLVNSVRAAASLMTYDDRAAITWLRDQHRPGDLTILVGSATRAAQWYDPHGDLSPVRSVVAGPAGPECDPAEFGRQLVGYRRVLAYSGIRLPSYEGTHVILEEQLRSLGTVTEIRRFHSDGIGYIAELSGPTASRTPAQCLKLD